METPPISELIKALNVDIEPTILNQALTHRSFAYENGGLPTNERLEFLGDAVLGLVVTENLYAMFPEEQEGQLAKLRAAVVNAQALAEVARTLDVGSYLKLGKGEESTGGRDKSSILADALEAVIGAIFIANGLSSAREFIESMFNPLILASAGMGAGLDWKTSLQEVSALLDLGVPAYRSTHVGPDHEKVFTAEVVADGIVMGTGTGRSKKVAEQEAAAEAYSALMARYELQQAQAGE
jgi:ribonuclease-3